MTDLSLCRPILRRRLVSESDTDPMNSTANPWIYPNRFIPPGQTESQPNFSGLGFITGPGMRPQSQKIYSESRITGIMERFEEMKMEINEWKTSTESQFMSLDAINDQASSLAELSQDLAKEAIMAGVDLTLCGEISNYKNIVTQIKENTLKRIKL